MTFARGQWASVAIANGASLSSAIDLGRIYDFIQLDVPAVNATSVGIDVSRTAGGTYNALGTTAAVDISAGSKQYVLNIHGHQFLKVNCTNAQGAARTVWYRGYAL